MAHATVNAALALASNNNALAGAAGATLGEAMGMIALNYYGKNVDELSEQQKQTVSTLATLAAGLAGGIAGNSTADAVTGAQAGKTTVENNFLNPNSIPKGMMDYGQAVASWNQYAVDNNLTPEQTKAGMDKLAKGELPEGANITKAIVEGYQDGVLIAGVGYLGPAASIGKVVAGSMIGEIANGTYQWFDLNQLGNESKNWDYKSSVSAALTGALAPGRGIWTNASIAMGGALFTDGVNPGAIGSSALGSIAGGMFGRYAPKVTEKVLGNDQIPGIIYDFWGGVASEFSTGFIKDLNKPKLNIEDNK